MTLSSTPGADPGPGKAYGCLDKAANYGWYSLFDGTKETTEKYFYLPTGQRHGNGGKWTINDKILAGKQNGAGQGGALYTKKQYKNVESKILIKPTWGNDGGFFLRAATSNQSYQVVIDYLGGDTKAVGGVWGERNLHSINYKPFGFNSATSIDVLGPWYLNGTAGREKLTAADWPTKIWKATDYNWVHAKIYHNDPPWIDTWINGYQMVHYVDGTIEQQNLTGSVAFQVHGGGSWSSSNSPNLYKEILIRDVDAMTGAPLASYPDWDTQCQTSRASMPYFSMEGSSVAWKMDASRRLRIDGYAAAPFVLDLTNLMGRSVFRTTGAAGNFERNVAMPSEGAFILKLQGPGFVRTEKITAP